MVNRKIEGCIRGNFPGKAASEVQVQSARSRDYDQKKDNEDEVNASKYRKASNFNPGDMVLVRNHNATSKFDPKFTPEPYTVVSIDNESKKVVLESSECAKRITRHPDDIKPYYGNEIQRKAALDTSMENVGDVAAGFPMIDPFQEEYDDNDGTFEKGSLPKETLHEIPATVELNRPTREKKPNQRYINSDFVN